MPVSTSVRPPKNLYITSYKTNDLVHGRITSSGVKCLPWQQQFQTLATKETAELTASQGLPKMTGARSSLRLRTGHASLLRLNSVRLFPANGCRFRVPKRRLPASIKPDQRRVVQNGREYEAMTDAWK